METMEGMKRTHHCGELRATNEGQEVVLCGWVPTFRTIAFIFRIIFITFFTILHILLILCQIFFNICVIQFQYILNS